VVAQQRGLDRRLLLDEGDVEVVDDPVEVHVGLDVVVVGVGHTDGRVWESRAGVAHDAEHVLVGPRQAADGVHLAGGGGAVAVEIARPGVPVVAVRVVVQPLEL